MLRLVGNLLWFLIAGWSMCLAYLVAGALLCITIVGIPFGVASFRLAFFVIWPFGRVAVHDPNRVPGVSAVANVLWFVLAGWWLALGHLMTGVLLCLTIIGIPFGIQAFKLAGLALAPLAREIVSTDDPRYFVRPT
jgi:uncharacterized membrane protein YccF (DUF307 family)